MKVVDKSNYDNDWYNPGSIRKRIAWQFISVLFFQNGFFPFHGFKVKLLKLFGARIGKNLTIKQNVSIKYPWLLEGRGLCWYRWSLCG